MFARGVVCWSVCYSCGGGTGAWGVRLDWAVWAVFLVMSQLYIMDCGIRRVEFSLAVLVQWVIARWNGRSRWNVAAWRIAEGGLFGNVIDRVFISDEPVPSSGTHSSRIYPTET